MVDLENAGELGEKEENGEAVGTRFDLYVPYEYKYV